MMLELALGRTAIWPVSLFAVRLLERFPRVAVEYIIPQQNILPVEPH